MDIVKLEKLAIKIGMFIILGLAASIYYYSKISVGEMAEMGPPPPTAYLAESYYRHKEELLLWYDKFVIPFLLPAFLYWFHRVVDAKYKVKKEET